MFKFIGSCFRWVGLQLGLVKGAVDNKNEKLMRNPTLIRQEGEQAAEELKESYRQLNGVIAGKVAARVTKEQRIKTNSEKLAGIAAARGLKITTQGKDQIGNIGFQLYNLSRGMNAASSKLRARAIEIGAVDADGNIDRKSTIGQGDKLFCEHLAALTNFATKTREFQEELNRIEADTEKTIANDTDAVKVANAQLINDKSRLTEMKNQLADLAGQIEDIISDVIGAEEAKKQDEILASIDTTTATNRLNKLKDLQRKAQAESAVANEMNSGSIVADTYLNGYVDSAVDDDIDALLNPNRVTTPTPTRHVENTETETLPNG